MQCYTTIRTIFVHNPRAGGSSLERYLTLKYAFGKSIGGHATIQDFAKKYKLEDYYKFVIIRNPWDRFVSSYLHLKSHYKNKAYQRYIDILGLRQSEFTFSQVLQKYASLPLSEKQQLIHFLPQYLFMIDKNKKIAVDKIIRFENYKTDIQKVFQEIIKRNPDRNHRFNVDRIPVINASQNKEHQRYQDYYTPEEVKIVEKLYYMDVKLFKYQFE